MAYNMFQGYNPQSVTGPMDLYIQRQDAQMAQDKQLQRQDRQIDLAERQYADLYQQRQAEAPMKQMEQHFNVAEKMFKFDPEGAVRYVNENIPGMSASLEGMLQGPGGSKIYSVGMRGSGPRGGGPSKNVNMHVDPDGTVTSTDPSSLTPQRITQAWTYLMNDGGVKNVEEVRQARADLLDAINNRPELFNSTGELTLDRVRNAVFGEKSVGSGGYDKTDPTTWNEGQLVYAATQARQEGEFETEGYYRRLLDEKRKGSQPQTQPVVPPEPQRSIQALGGSLLDQLTKPITKMFGGEVERDWRTVVGPNGQPTLMDVNTGETTEEVFTPEEADRNKKKKLDEAWRLYDEAQKKSPTSTIQGPSLRQSFGVKPLYNLNPFK